MKSNTKVLMLGWEFPPFVEGGLAGATFGLVNALRRHADITLILPKYKPTKIWENVKVIGLDHAHVLVERGILGYRSSAYYKNFIDNKLNIFEKLAGPYPDSSTKRIRKESNPISIVSDIVTSDETILNNLKWLSSKDVYGDGIWGQLEVYKTASTIIAQKLDFDVIHAHDWVTFLTGVQIKIMTGKPLVIHVHSLETDRINEHVRNEIYDIEKYAMQHADKIFPVSEYTKSKIIELYQIDESKIAAIHNGITVYEDSKRWFHPLNRQIVAYVGRITSQKGTTILMETAAKVIQRNRQTLFVIAGKGDQLSNIMMEAAKRKISSNIVFTGFIKEHEVDKLLATADVYFMPSVSEPFGLSALEAVRAGTPCVISKQSGVSEVLPDSHIADFWDVDKFADLISSILEKKVNGQEFAIKESKKKLKNISWELAANKILEHYKTILN